MRFSISSPTIFAILGLRKTFGIIAINAFFISFTPFPTLSFFRFIQHDLYIYFILSRHSTIYSYTIRTPFAHHSRTIHAPFAHHAFATCRQWVTIKDSFISPLHNILLQQRKKRGGLGFSYGDFFLPLS